MKTIKNKIGEFKNAFLSLMKDTLILFAQNWGDIVLFSILCGIGSLFISLFLKNALLRIACQKEGMAYLDSSDVIQIATSPYTIGLLAIFLIIMTFSALFEIGGLLHAYATAQVGRKTDLASMFYAGARICVKTLNPVNWPVILFVLVLFPLTEVFCLSNSAYKAEIPSFIMLAIDADRLYLRAFNVVYIFLLVFELAFLFSISIYVLEKRNFIQSCAASWKLGKKNLLKTVLSLAVLAICLWIFINSVVSVLIVNVVGMVSWLTGGDLEIGSGAYESLFMVVRHILNAIVRPAINNAFFTVLFFRYIDENEMLDELSRDSFRTVGAKEKKGVAAVAAVFLIVTCVYGVHLFNSYSFVSEDVEKPLVCAHRGDNVHAPENTLEAFQLAIAENVPWIEVDVQQTKDGVIICSHDTNIQRLCGVNIPIHSLTYEELQQYEMGDWLPGDYEHVHYTTLEEVLKLAKKSHVKTQVDIKLSGYEQNLEEGILQIINETGMHDDTMVISIYSEAIKKTKELDPTMVTAHAVMQAWEEYGQLKDADNLSLELYGVSAKLVDQMHKAGKGVYCWTADDREDIQYYVSCGMDVIGTNDPVMVTEELSEADYSGGIPRALHLFMKMITEMER